MAARVNSSSLGFLAILLLLLGSGCSQRSVETVSGPSTTAAPKPAKLIPANFAIFVEPADGYAARIYVALPVSCTVLCEVRNVAGYHVKTLFKGSVEPGVINVPWDGTNDNGERVNDGFYFASGKAGSWSGSAEFVIKW